MLSIKEWQLKYKTGYFTNVTKEKIIEAGWYDWFCSYDELNTKMQHNSDWILELCNSSKISIDKNGLIFSNKLIFNGLYYDSVKIIDIDNDIDLLLIDIYKVRNNFIYKVYDIKTYSKKIYETVSTKELARFLNL